MGHTVPCAAPFARVPDCREVLAFPKPTAKHQDRPESPFGLDAVTKAKASASEQHHASRTAAAFVRPGGLVRQCLTERGSDRCSPPRQAQRADLSLAPGIARENAPARTAPWRGRLKGSRHAQGSALAPPPPGSSRRGDDMAPGGNSAPPRTAAPAPGCGRGSAYLWCRRRGEASWPRRDEPGGGRDTPLEAEPDIAQAGIQPKHSAWRAGSLDADPPGTGTQDCGRFRSAHAQFHEAWKKLSPSDLGLPDDKVNRRLISLGDKRLPPKDRPAISERAFTSIGGCRRRGGGSVSRPSCPSCPCPPDATPAGVGGSRRREPRAAPDGATLGWNTLPRRGRRRPLGLPILESGNGKFHTGDRQSDLRGTSVFCRVPAMRLRDPVPSRLFGESTHGFPDAWAQGALRRFLPVPAENGIASQPGVSDPP